MKKHWASSIVAAVVLLLLSATFFALQHLIFAEPKEAGFLFFQDLAFLPLHVLFVTLILDRAINAREKRERLEQMHIVISAFYSEVGADAIGALNPFIGNIADLRTLFSEMEAWPPGRFGAAAERVPGYTLEADSRAGDLEAVKRLLSEKKAVLLTMFENPNLLEHSRFTNMLWAVYHLQDELANRDDLGVLPETDRNHLSTDIERAYRMLLVEWVYYMRHLKGSFPYLYSLAVRKNPFRTDRSVVVR